MPPRFLFAISRGRTCVAACSCPTKSVLSSPHAKVQGVCRLSKQQRRSPTFGCCLERRWSFRETPTPKHPVAKTPQCTNQSRRSLAGCREPPQKKLLLATQQRTSAERRGLTARHTLAMTLCAIPSTCSQLLFPLPFSSVPSVRFSLLLSSTSALLPVSPLSSFSPAPFSHLKPCHPSVRRRLFVDDWPLSGP